MKITFIGAGSVQFTTAVVHDITTYTDIRQYSPNILHPEIYKADERRKTENMNFQ